MTRKIAILFMMLLVGGALLSSCRMLKGDPRKNCNHPDHGDYIREREMRRIKG